MRVWLAVLAVSGALGGASVDPYPYDGTWTGRYAGTSNLPGSLANFDAGVSVTVARNSMSGSFSGTVSGGAGRVSGCVFAGESGSGSGTISFGASHASGQVSCSARGISTSGTVTLDRVGGPKPKPEDPTGEDTKNDKNAQAVANIEGDGLIYHVTGPSEDFSGAATLEPGASIFATRRTRVRLPDGSIIYLDKNSQWRYCGPYGVNGTPRDCVRGIKYPKGTIIWESQLGRIYYRIKKRKKPLVVRTFNVVVAVRGTAFTVDTSGATERLQMYEGTVAVDTVSPASCRKLLVKKGQQVLASGTYGCSSKPTRFKPAAKPFWKLPPQPPASP